MSVFMEFLAGIENAQHRARTDEVLQWVTQKFPELTPKIAWNQPMFTAHETFIIGFSVSKKHLAVSPEIVGIDRFSADIIQAGYEHSKNLFRIRWEDAVNYELLENMIAFNMADKAECTTFWRK